MFHQQREGSDMSLSPPHCRNHVVDCPESEETCEESCSSSSFDSACSSTLSDDSTESSFDYAELEYSVSQVLSSASKRSPPATDSTKVPHLQPTGSSPIRKSTSTPSLRSGLASVRSNKSSSSLSLSNDLSDGINIEDASLMASIREDLLQLSTVLRSRKGSAFRERAVVLASINYLARNVPCCVLRHLGREVRQADARSYFSDQYSDPDTSCSSSVSSCSLESMDSSCHLLELQQQSLTRIHSLESGTILDLPYVAPFLGVVLFVDIVGFTELSARLGPEIVSRVINTFFERLLAKIFIFDGDIQKFSGDAFFAEWRVTPTRTLKDCANLAALCTCSLATEFKDYPINISSGANSEVAKMNCHFGLGVGEMVGIHVGDNECRRQYLHVGDPIAQATNACKLAGSGEVVLSSEFYDILSGSRVHSVLMVQHEGDKTTMKVKHYNIFQSFAKRSIKKAEDIRKSRAITEHVEGLGLDSLKEYQRLIALYCHPVVCVGGSSERQILSDMKESREHKFSDNPELRNVFVAFLNAALPQLHRSVDVNGIDKTTVHKINQVFNRVSHELLHYGGYIEAFIDDKGFSMMITFGLKGSMFPNLVSAVALPAILSVKDVLSTEVNVNCRVGSTYGKVHCGYLGSAQRHEYTVLGPSVNLAARLMTCELNKGILVDESVRDVPGGSFAFERIGEIKAKGIGKRLVTYTPYSFRGAKSLNHPAVFVGRNAELGFIADKVTDAVSSSNIVLVTGPYGIGKSCLLARASSQIDQRFGAEKQILTESIACDKDGIAEPYAALKPIMHKIFDTSGTSTQCDHVDSLESRKSEHNERQHNAFGGDGDSLNIDHEVFSDLNPRQVSQRLASFFKKYDLVVLSIDDCHRLDMYSWISLCCLVKENQGVIILAAATSTVSLRGWDSTTGLAMFATLRQMGQLSILELGNFSADEVASLVTQTLSLSNLSDEIQHNIFIESGGRPLFAKQIMGWLQGHGHSEHGEDLLIHRLDSLQYVERRCLKVAACMGNQFCAEDVSHILATEESIPLDHCSKAFGVLVKAGILCFHAAADINRVSYRFRDARWRKKVLELTLKSEQEDLYRLLETRRPSSCLNS